MKLVIDENMLFEMSNIRGKYVKNPHRLDFSFYFSPKDAVEGKDICHGLRVKPIFNPEKMDIQSAGTLKLHGDWKYIPGTGDISVSNKKVKEMKQFFTDYKILFAAVWEKVLPPDSLYDYFRDTITFSELLQELDFYEDYKEVLSYVTNVIELNMFVKEHNLFNTWED